MMFWDKILNSFLKPLTYKSIDYSDAFVGTTAYSGCDWCDTCDRT